MKIESTGKSGAILVGKPGIEKLGLAKFNFLPIFITQLLQQKFRGPYSRFL